MYFGKNEGKPVTVVCTENTFVEGKLLEQGQVVDDMPHELALDLAGSGKVRTAKDADVAAWKAKLAERKKAAKPAETKTPEA
jgi:hypothetical protein